MLWPYKSDFAFGLLQTGFASRFLEGPTSGRLAHETHQFHVSSQLKT